MRYCFDGGVLAKQEGEVASLFGFALQVRCSSCLLVYCSPGVVALAKLG